MDEISKKFQYFGSHKIFKKIKEKTKKKRKNKKQKMILDNRLPPRGENRTFDIMAKDNTKSNHPLKR